MPEPDSAQRFAGVRGLTFTVSIIINIILNSAYLVVNLAFMTIPTALIFECKNRSEQLNCRLLSQPQENLVETAHQVGSRVIYLEKDRAKALQSLTPKFSLSLTSIDSFSLL